MLTFTQAEPIRLPFSLGTPEEAAAFVRRADLSFDRRLEAAAAAIAEDCTAHGVRLIRLSGPTCAGKTTTARKLTEVLEAAGRVVYPISLDDFFYDRAVLHARAASRADGELDYDSVETLDLDTLAASVRDLLATGSADIPVFDFVSGNRMGMRRLAVPDGVEPVFLFEGIQAVYPAVAALFEGVPSRSVFINVERETTLVGPDGEERVFAPARIRLLRRLVRDEAKRGATPDFTLTLWRSVRANEKLSILPNAPACDYGIDSNMAFDIHMLAPHLRRIFREHPCDGAEVAVAEALLRSLEGVEGISDDTISENSLYHEFILK